MINVYDPLFKLDKLPVAPADLATAEKNAVEYIGNIMGYQEISEACTYKSFSELDNLYNNDCSIVIPIVNEKLTSDKLSNVLSNNYNVSYLVITPKSGDITVSATTSPKYSSTNDDGTASTDAAAVKVTRMVNFRFYRNMVIGTDNVDCDTHPIVYDALQSVYFGYKTGASGETQICLDGINIFLKQQAIQFKKDEIFPFYPTDSSQYMVGSTTLISAIGSTDTLNTGLVNSELNAIADNNSLYCHITGRFYILENMSE